MARLILVNGSAASLFASDDPLSVDRLAGALKIPTDLTTLFVSVKIKYGPADPRPRFGSIMNTVMQAFERAAPDRLKPIRAVLGTISRGSTVSVCISYGSGTDIIGG
jgi:hypothetical protein